jgi:hypothetical protein
MRSSDVKELVEPIIAGPAIGLLIKFVPKSQYII